MFHLIYRSAASCSVGLFASYVLAQGQTREFLQYKDDGDKCHGVFYIPCPPEAKPGDCTPFEYRTCDAPKGDPKRTLSYQGAFTPVDMDCCGDRVVACSVPKNITELLIDADECTDAPDLSVLKNLKKGDYYRVRVTNVNLNLYRVSINGRDTSTAKPLDFPTFALFGVEGLGALASGIGNVVTSASQQAAASETEPANLAYVQTIRDDGGVQPIDYTADRAAIEALIKSGFSTTLYSAYTQAAPGEELQATQFEMIDLQKNGGTVAAATEAKINLGSIKERMKQESDELARRSGSIIAIKDATDLAVSDAHRFILRTKVARKNAPFASQLSDGAFHLDGLAATMYDQRRALVDQRSGIVQRADDYDAFYEKNKAEIEKDDDLKALHGRITDAQKKIATTVGDAITALSVEKVNELMGTLVLLGNNTGQDYVSLPQQYNGGAGSVALRIDPIDAAKTNLGSYATTLRFNDVDRTYGGMSLGFFIGGLHDEAYSTLKKTTAVNDSTDVSTYTLVEEEPGSIEFGASALFITGRKFANTDRVGYHFAFGPGVAISDKVRARLLFGPGLSFGRKHMLMLNVGGILGYTQQLANNYTSDGIYSEKPEDVTVARLNTSLFVSLGYMFKF